MSLIRPSQLRRLLPSLVLVLWLVPQWSLAGHGHWFSEHGTPDCDICLLLSGTTPAVDTSTTVPVVLAATAAPAMQDQVAFTRYYAMVACRGPPIFPQPSSHPF